MDNVRLVMTEDDIEEFISLAKEIVEGIRSS
jgi:hypothetical protein